MIADAHLWLFFVVVFGVIVLPGLDMAFVLGSSVVRGTRAGLVAVGGIVAGGVCHVAMGVLGIGILLRVLPGAFNAMLLAGALYLVWIGVSMLRSASGFRTSTPTLAHSPWTTFRQALLTCLLNPKAYLFTLAILPQFLRPQYGTLATQAVVLWLIIAATQAGVYGAVALVAGRLRHWLVAHPRAGVTVNRGVGAALVLAAAFTGYEGWQRL
ncbi:MAG TPA: LysE family translocator [Rhodanobacteraceae bacterium]|nr:LysE family translocator [Rhodanobacteraceae bacterium]